MSGTSSARPARLHTYADVLEDPDDSLDRLAGDIDDAISAAKTGAGSFGSDIDADAPGVRVRALAAESRHLRRWVDQVGTAFDEVGSGVALVSADDQTLSKMIGEPTIEEAEQAREGQESARELRDQLLELGVDPDNFDPEDLRDLDPRDPRYAETYELLEEIGERMGDEDFAVGFYDRMNEEGIRATIGLIETFAAHQQYPPLHLLNSSTEYFGEPPVAPEFDVKADLLDPFVHGWAIASGSVDLDEERAGLLDPDGDINGDGRWEQHQLAILLSDDGRHYDPTFLARGADVILNRQANNNWPNLGSTSSGSVYDHAYPPLGIGQDLWGSDLSFNELIAMSALADNTEATYEFVNLGGDTSRTDRLELLIKPNTYVIQGQVGGRSSTLDYDDAEELMAQMERYGADAVDNLATGVPLRYGDKFFDQSVDIYADIVRVTGTGNVPDVTKRVIANGLPLYLDEIGRAAHVQQQSVYTHDEAARQDFNRPDLVAFFQELGYDEEAAAEVGESMTVWAFQRGLPLFDADADASFRIRDLKSAYYDLSLVLGAVEDGFDETGRSKEAAHGSFVQGLQFGGNLLKTVGVAAIPATGGASLALTGASALATPLLNRAISALAGSPEDQPISGGQLETALTEELRRTYAVLIAEKRGDPRPQPGEYDIYLDSLDQFEFVGEPVEYIDGEASEEARDYAADAHWAEG